MKLIFKFKNALSIHSMEDFNEDYFEKVLLKKVMTDNTSMALLVNKIEPDIFSKDCFKNVMKYYIDFFRENGRIPKSEEVRVTIKNNSLANDFMQVIREVKVVEQKEIAQDFFLNYSERFIKRRMAILAIKQITDAYAKNTELNPDTLVDIFTKVAQIKVIQNLGFDIYADIQRYVDEWATDEARLSFGFDTIDEYTNGGMPAKGKFLGVVAAPSNMGKSIFLGNLAVNAVKQGKRVLLISLEMSEMVYAARVYASLYGLDIDTVQVATAAVKKCVELQHTGKMIIKEFPPATMTVEEIDGYIDTLKKAGHEFDLVCIDYLTLLRAPGADNSNEAGKTVSRKLRALSYKYEIPFFTAAQVNRDGFDGVPELQNMAESIAIVSEADFILMLYQQEEDVSQDIMRCSIKKSRLGRKDVDMRLRFNLKSLRFEDCGLEDLTQSDEEEHETTSRQKESQNEVESVMNLLGLQ